jgi:hypothetical protein
VVDHNADQKQEYEDTGTYRIEEETGDQEQHVASLAGCEVIYHQNSWQEEEEEVWVWENQGVALSAGVRD